MKKIILSLLLSMSVLSCSEQNTSKKEVVPHEFDSYFDQFVRQLRSDTSRYIISTGDFNNITVFKFDSDENVQKHENNTNARAYCEYNLQEHRDSNVFYKKIVFGESLKNEDLWFQYQIFLKEIGHCAYHLSNNTKIGNHIMSPDFIRMQYTDLYEAETEYFEDARNNEKNWGDQRAP